MDPDLVRQQEEAEAASRLRRPIPAAAAGMKPPVSQAHPVDTPFVLRADPREQLIASAPSAPPKPLGWGPAMHVATTSFVFTSLGLVAGILLGVQLGLVSWQSFAIGAAAGYFLGWQSAYASLRKRYKLGFRRALHVPLLPTAMILIALVAGMAVAAFRVGVPGPALTEDPHSSYWLNAGLVALIGYVLAALKLRKVLRPDANEAAS
jgi:hypothetical protein